MSDSRLAKVAESLVKTAPLTDVFLALMAGASSLIAGLPKAELEKAIGQNPKFFSKSDPVNFDDFVRIDDFLASLLGAQIFHLPYLGVTLIFGLLAGSAYLWLKSCAEKPLDWKTSRQVARGTIIGLAVLILTVVVLHPKYRAPWLIRDLGVRLERPEAFARSGWTQKDFRKLYGWFHGIPEANTPILGGRRDATLHLPTRSHFENIRGYFDLLASFTIWSLLLLLLLSFLGGSTLLRRPGYRRGDVVVLTLFLMAGSFIHAFQWCWLAADYGRLIAASRLLEQQASTYQEDANITDYWPFRHPVIRKAESGTVIVENFWPAQDLNPFNLNLRIGIMSAGAENFKEGNLVLGSTKVEVISLGKDHWGMSLTIDELGVRKSLKLEPHEQIESIEISDGYGWTGIERWGSPKGTATTKGPGS